MILKKRIDLDYVFDKLAYKHKKTAKDREDELQTF